MVFELELILLGKYILLAAFSGHSPLPLFYQYSRLATNRHYHSRQTNLIRHFVQAMVLPSLHIEAACKKTLQFKFNEVSLWFLLKFIRCNYARGLWKVCDCHDFSFVHFKITSNSEKNLWLSPTCMNTALQTLATGKLTNRKRALPISVDAPSRSNMLS